MRRVNEFHRVCLSVCLSVCVCVCNALTYESVDSEKNGQGGISIIKVIGSRSRSQAIYTGGLSRQVTRRTQSGRPIEWPFHMFSISVLQYYDIAYYRSFFSFVSR